VKNILHLGVIVNKKYDILGVSEELRVPKSQAFLTKIPTKKLQPF